VLFFVNANALSIDFLDIPKDCRNKEAIFFPSAGELHLTVATGKSWISCGFCFMSSIVMTMLSALPLG
jgi:hypothetical protein